MNKLNKVNSGIESVDMTDEDEDGDEDEVDDDEDITDTDNSVPKSNCGTLWNKLKKLNKVIEQSLWITA